MLLSPNVTPEMAGALAEIRRNVYGFANALLPLASQATGHVRLHMTSEVRFGNGLVEIISEGQTFTLEEFDTHLNELEQYASSAG